MAVNRTKEIQFLLLGPAGLRKLTRGPVRETGTLYADFSSGTITLTGSGTESHSHSLAASGTLTFSGTATESASHDLSADGVIVLDGVGIEDFQPFLLLDQVKEQRFLLFGPAGLRKLNKGPTSDGPQTTYFDSGTGTINLDGVGVEDFQSGEALLNRTREIRLLLFGPGGRLRMRPNTTKAIDINYVDAGSGTITLGDAFSDSQTHTGSGTGTITLSGSGTESTGPADSGTGVITLSGSGTQSQTHTGSGSGTITLSGSAVASQVHASSASGTITLSGTGVHSAVYSDSGSGQLTLAGSFTQSQVHTASATGALTLSGSGVENTGGATQSALDESTAVRLVLIHS